MCLAEIHQQVLIALVIWNMLFAKHGIRIPRTADEQYKLGKLVEPDDLEAGDLVLFLLRMNQEPLIVVFT